MHRLDHILDYFIRGAGNSIGMNQKSKMISFWYAIFHIGKNHQEQESALVEIHNVVNALQIRSIQRNRGICITRIYPTAH